MLTKGAGFIALPLSLEELFETFKSLAIHEGTSSLYPRSGAPRPLLGNLAAPRAWYLALPIRCHDFEEIGHLSHVYKPPQLV